MHGEQAVHDEEVERVMRLWLMRARCMACVIIWVLPVMNTLQLSQQLRSAEVTDLGVSFTGGRIIFRRYVMLC